MNNKKTAKIITKRLAQQKRQQINKIVDNWKEPMRRETKIKVTKRHWYDVLGGFENPNCFRKHNGKCWEYFYNKQLD